MADLIADYSGAFIVTLISMAAFNKFFKMSLPPKFSIINSFLLSLIFIVLITSFTIGDLLYTMVLYLPPLIFWMIVFLFRLPTKEKEEEITSDQ